MKRVPLKPYNMHFLIEEKKINIDFLFSLKSIIDQSFWKIPLLFFYACLEEILFQILHMICMFSF